MTISAIAPSPGPTPLPSSIQSPSPSREPATVMPAAAQAPRPAEQVRDAVREAVALEQEKKAAEVTPQQASVALDEINQSLQLASIGVRFEFDREARTMITKVVDVQSGEMIRQMPNEEVVRVSKMLGQLQGLLVSEKA